MKKGMLIIVMIVFLISVVSAEVPEEVCPTGIINYWTFDADDVDGNDVFDVVGDNDGTILGATTGVNGQVGNAMEFDGTVNNYVLMTDSLFLAYNTFYSPIGHIGNMYNRIEHIADPDYDFYFTTDNGASGVFNSALPTTPWWHYVSLVCDGADSNNLELYIDGNSKGKISKPTTNLNFNLIGKNWYGLLDEIAVFSRALSASEVAEIYNKGLSGNGYCAQPSTTTCISNNHIIMKLYQDSNSHGALWNVNDKGYDVDICYDGAAPENPHTCTADNTFLWLKDTYNSHASTTKIIGSYETPVCYGGLSCNVEDHTEDASEVCADGNTPLLSLYQKTNSHISKGNDINYPIKICCGEGTDVYWADMKGKPISNANKFDSVKLMVNIAGEIDFKIKEKNDLFGIDWLWPDSKVATDSSEGFIVWEAGKKQEGIFEEGKFYFIATIDGTDYNSKDYGVNGLLNVAGFDNSPPSTNILKPLLDTNYTAVLEEGAKTTGDIDFEQISSDIDDDLKLTWDFGDGSALETFENIITTKEGNTTHSYSSDNWGTKVIVLTAEEMTRNQVDEDTTRIYVYKEGINVFAIIDSPSPNEIQNINGRVVNINANRSHAAKCFKTPGCGGESSSCYEVVDELGNSPLYCYKLAQNGLKMEWTFDEGTFQETTKSGIYDSSDSDEVVDFIHVFSNPGKHTLKLKVGYDTESV